MNKSKFDQITFVIFVAFWPVWLVWELVLLWLRAHHGSGPIPVLISGEAKNIGWHLSSVVYLWGGLALHFWWPSKKFASVAGSISFWSIAVLFFVQDLFLWNKDIATWPAWERWERWPLVVLIFGAVAGKLLFPQAGASPWDPKKQ